jgi:hypothetical protein
LAKFAGNPTRLADLLEVPENETVLIVSGRIHRVYLELVRISGRD